MIAPDEPAARRLLFERAAEPNVFETGAGVLQWRGEVTTQTVPVFWDLTQRFVNDWGVAQRTLAIDLAPVRYLDSAGIQLMRRVREYARQRRVNLEFRRPSPAVGQVLAMAGEVP
jgi:anti-anti-sigma factor